MKQQSTVFFSLTRFLIETFQLQDHDKNPRSAILLDLYFFTIQFAIDSGFNKEQTSTFFSIVKKTHEVCIGKCNKMTFMI